MEFICVPVGDQAISLQFTQEISLHVNDQVIKMAQWIRKLKLKGVIELVPSYTSLLIYYNPLVITYNEVIEQLHAYTNIDHELVTRQKRIITIPALYGGEYGPDLEDVAELHDLTVADVIKLHISVAYRVYMLGFSPGFPYLGGLPIALHTPRLPTPRTMIPAGSIGIAGSQTGIYSLSTPGGWRIIAHTPVPLFDLGNEKDPFLLQAGDSIRFLSVNIAEYREISEQIKQGLYTPMIENVDKEDHYED